MSNLSITIFKFDPYFDAMKNGAKVIQVDIKPDVEVRSKPHHVALAPRALTLNPLWCFLARIGNSFAKG
jgi:hypothetical protein